MENKGGYKIQDDGTLGDVKISEEVIAIIAGLATTEVDGVAKMCGNITNELVSKLGMKSLSKGVRVNVEGKNVSIDVAVELEYGVSVTTVSNKVQEKVKTAIENMTGLTIDEVNVRVAGVALEDE
ncbi:MAG: Asp23/Gls24 family envelope stress response protein [Anaerostipes sp.]|jgi:uncharacterized alkaline shock family protein YloU|nr:Asp23/Gls24 family envelope stress response protein [Anaerostipes sp.]MDD3747008.1 Asp23/Gls24 family envelope stress response protein [Anaerostipes sp.]MDD4372075.1 Asp23/Gls24 family envelope stress response protein [Anaerostipes sp.]